MAKTGATPSALTKDAKAMIQLAFEDLGGLPRLVEWANNPANIGIFYTQLWSKIIPKDIKAEVDGNITIEVVKFDNDQYALQHNGNRIVMNQTPDDILIDAIVKADSDED